MPSSPCHLCQAFEFAVRQSLFALHRAVAVYLRGGTLADLDLAYARASMARVAHDEHLRDHDPPEPQPPSAAALSLTPTEH